MPTSRVTVTIDHAWFWRHNAHDGCMESPSTWFALEVRVVRATWGGNSRRKSISEWMTISRVVTGTAFFTGRFLRETPPGDDVAYVTVSSTYRF